jgi:hypothetical protein
MPFPTGAETLGDIPVSAQFFDKGGAVYNVMHEDFGARGDGVTDDTAAIQAALNAAKVVAGSELYFPAGRYRVTSSLFYQHSATDVINPGVILRGAGRRSSIIEYEGISGFCLNFTGAPNTAIAAIGRLGLIEGVVLQHLGLTGTGSVSGNSDGGVYIQAYSHFLIDDCFISKFGQDGVHLDRLYYVRAPDPTLDDRGAFATIRHSEISDCGRTGLQAGGLNSADDYSADHLLTENLHITINKANGAKIYTNNWTDIGSLFHGEVIGVHLYTQNSDILTQNVSMLGSRIEGGQSDCMLKIDSCLSGRFVNCFFPGHAGPLPLTQVKIASDALYNVGHVTFENCIHQTGTTAIDVVGDGGVVGVRVINPRYANITTEIANGNNKPVQHIKGPDFIRVSGGGAPLGVIGGANTHMTGLVDGDAFDYFELQGSGRSLRLGNGVAAAPDAGMNRLNITAQTAPGMTWDVPISVQQTQAFIYSGTGSPEGAVAADIGSIYLRTDGGAVTSLYVKESGVGDTGWVAK